MRARLVALLLAPVAAVAALLPAAPAPANPVCAPGGPPVVLTGAVTTDDAKVYRLLPVDVAAGTTRLEVGYSWKDATPLPSTPVSQTVLDLGLWDTDGYRATSGFRGWTGSRQGKLHAGQAPVWIQPDKADRGLTPGPVDAGTWWVELGVGAVAPGGATWRVEVTCKTVPVGGAPAPDPVDPAHVASTEAGWYHGDFHMHGFHSNPAAPSQARFVEYARAAGLDFLPITDYVVGRHWTEWGATQRANPDLLVWPGREIITYKGHANVIGETANVLEYRHGFEDVTLGDIQRRSKADGALFQVNHPEIFPGPVFSSFCRGCDFELEADIDWDLVDTLEVLTGPILVDDGDLGGPNVTPQIQNPFVEPAIDLWERKLSDGFRVTAVSGSDDKMGPGLGSSATAVYGTSLSRAGITEGIRAGRAYVRTKGVAGSPTVDVAGRTADGQIGGLGTTFTADSATVDVRVQGGAGQVLKVTVDGTRVLDLPITGDDVTLSVPVHRLPTSGPLGTFWRFDTADAQSLTTIGNPIFLAPASA